MMEWIIFVVLAFILIALILIEEKQGQIVKLLERQNKLVAHTAQIMQKVKDALEGDDAKELLE